MFRIACLGCLLTAAAASAQDRRSLGVLSGAEKRIEETLSQEVNVWASGQALNDFLDQLGRENGVRIQIDAKALADAGVAEDTPVTVDVGEVTLKSALQLVLHQFDLTWTIDNDALVITTANEAENRLITRAYDIDDLVAGSDGEEQLIGLIVETVQPATWDVVGGAGTTMAFAGKRAHALVITQTAEVHGEVARLLSDLRRLPVRPSAGGFAGQNKRQQRRPRVARARTRVYASPPAWNVPRNDE